nr:retrotransposon protein, putative, Ty1-copia subclass [Tanacetum cinerariifolium]
MHSIRKTIAELHDMLKLTEKGLPKKAETPFVLAIKGGKIQKDKKKPQGAKGKDKGNTKLPYALKPQILPPPKIDNLAKDSIRHPYKKLTPPYTPQHNGVSKKRNQTLLDMVRSMMNLTTLPKSFWGYDLEFVARILNMVPTKKVERMSYEIWHGNAP